MYYTFFKLFLIKLIYDFPGLICPVDRLDRIKDVYIPEEKLTLPVCVAFELGKRRYEKLSALQWYGLYGEKYPYPENSYGNKIPKGENIYDQSYCRTQGHRQDS